MPDDRPPAPQRPASDPLPDDAPPAPAPPTSAPAERADAPRTPDEYLETPGSHRREDGAATDVGA